MSTVTNCIIFENPHHNAALYTDSSLTALWEDTDSMLLEWNNRFTTDSISSEIFNLNNRQSQKLFISKELFDMLYLVKEFDRKHPRLFDPTIGPLKRFWKPTCTDCKEPLLISPTTVKTVKEILPRVDFSSVQIHDSDSLYTIHFSNPLTEIEVGGVAKGFVLNRVKDYYLQKGYTNFVISMGGDVFSTGGKPSGKPFTLGIQSPDDPAKLAQTFSFREGSVVTSGNYERYRIDSNGDRIHHIYSPESGYPSNKNKSLTIISPNPVLADLYSTALFSLQADSILTLVNNNPNLECFIIDIKNQKHHSKGFFSQVKGL